MIILTLYREPEGKREKREFALLQEAIEFGQKTGSYYDICDPVTGKVIDWNEINFTEEEDWYYDEKEFLWKKFKPDDGFYNGMACHEHQYSLMNFPAANGGSVNNLLHSPLAAT